MKSEVQKKVALITGASRGIGKSIAIELATMGINLCLTASEKRHLDDVAQVCIKLGVEVMTLGFDLAQAKKLSKAIDDVVATYGSLNYLINNAGIYDGNYTEDANLDDWDNVIDVNLRALMHLTKHALPHLKKAKDSAVINISSIAGKQAHAGGGVYSASKFGVLGFSGSLFDEVRDYGIKVSAICPGYVNTDMAAHAGIDLDKAIQPEDIAKIVGFILDFPKTSCPTEIIVRPQMSPVSK